MVWSEHCWRKAAALFGTALTCRRHGAILRSCPVPQINDSYLRDRTLEPRGALYGNAPFCSTAAPSTCTLALRLTGPWKLAGQFMRRSKFHAERHRTERIGWLRAAVLGANDGIVSTASLLVGVAAAGSSHGAILITGVAGLVAGAMSMAAGEYVSVHSQADTEQADIARESAELANDPAAERRELAAIYVSRGLKPELAQQVAEQLMARDAIGAHTRDELGISDTHVARPIQASLASAASFAVGALLPLIVVTMASAGGAVAWVAGSSIAFLAVLGAIAARAGGASALTGAWRVAFWGAAAIGITAGVGTLFGAMGSTAP